MILLACYAYLAWSSAEALISTVVLKPSMSELVGRGGCHLVLKLRHHTLALVHLGIRLWILLHSILST